MQNKHFLITHKNEDRSVFIDKLKYSKTIFHISDKPENGDILKDPNLGYHTYFCQWVLENYDNLPDYVVICQSIPDDHCHETLLAIDSTFTSDFGSLCYARSLYNQYTTNWGHGFSLPLRTLLHELDHGFINDNNSSKSIYVVYPGDINFVSKKRLLEKPKSFYQKIIDFDNNDKIYNLILNQDVPDHVYDDIDKNFPEYKNLRRKDKFEKLIDRDKVNRRYGMIGLCLEALWSILFCSEKTFKMLEKSQAVIGNKLYFDTRNSTYDSNFKFNVFPYNDNANINSIQLKLLENDWFKWDCPYYLKWRKTLVEKTIWEGQQRGFDGKELLEFYERVGYKHISL